MSSNVYSDLLTFQQVYWLYKDILNSYVSDFYTDNHWNKLPNCWKLFFGNVSMPDLGNLLNLNQVLDKKVFPLSIICIRALIVRHGLPRCQEIITFENELNGVFLKSFWKNVKEKKRHEIGLMSKNCLNTASLSECNYIVDIGSGLGHFSRMMAYGYGFHVCTFEADPNLTKEAYLLDSKFEDMLKKRNVNHKFKRKPIHINKRIENDINSQDFLAMVLKAFNVNNNDFKFGIIGLHPCGNLGATLLRLYLECPNAVFINIASCCYMKLGLSLSDNIGFPLSQFCKDKNFQLSYLSCELACHSIENFAKKLQEESYNNLKIHAYRAALEMAIEKFYPELRHTQLCSVKYNDSLTVKEYCERALKKFSIQLPQDDMSKLDQLIEKTWNKVLSFYSIRLLLAPLVENIILYDRMLYINENGSFCKITPLFDCFISPRNHVLMANKDII